MVRPVHRTGSGQPGQAGLGPRSTRTPEGLPAGQAFLAPSPGPLVGQSQDEWGDTRRRQSAHSQPSANTWVSGPRHLHCWHPPWTIRGRSRTVKARPLSGGRPRPRSRATAIGGEAVGGADRGREGGGLCVVRVGDGQGQNRRYGKLPHEGDSLPSQSPLVSNGCRNSRFEQPSPFRRHPPPGRSSRSRHLAPGRHSGAEGIGQHRGRCVHREDLRQPWQLLYRSRAPRGDPFGSPLSDAGAAGTDVAGADAAAGGISLGGLP
jgi:hypothetical protein